MKKVTVIGGGTGTFVVLSGLKQYPLDLGVIVTMMDSGGSTGRLRDQLGVLPPGDLRQCLLALSEAPSLWRQLFLYRFDKGDLKGHNFGNIFLSALEKVSPDYDQVIKTASFVLKTKGEVIPVTFKKTHLCVQYESGRKLRGEARIEENIYEKSKIIASYLEPSVTANKQAIERIKKSDFLVIGPGDLYTSIIPVLLVEKIKEAIASSKAKIIYIVNLMTKSGQTTNYKATDHLSDLEKYLDRSANYVIVNNGKIPRNILEWYLDHNEKIVVNDLDKGNFQGVVIEGDFVDNVQFEKSKADRLTRSILRHSPKKLSKVLADIIL